MTGLTRSALAIAFAAVLGAATTAHADTPPSRWEAIKDTSLDRNEYVHRYARKRLSDIRLWRQARGDLADLASRDLRTKLEEYGAETSHDVRLRFDLADVLAELREHRRAIGVLRAALEAAPQHTAAEHGWLSLAFACGHVGDHACEREAYVEVLRRHTEDDDRVVPMLNLAETEMHLGHLREAIEGYRETLRVAARLGPNTSAPLAVWGLSVALDRSGDRLQAEKEARFAIELERSSGQWTPLLRSYGVFFYPDYEVNWYEGLGAIARARAAKTAGDALPHWMRAERSFDAYVRGAEKANDRWLALAKARLTWVTAEKKKAEIRRAKEPAPRRGDDEGVVR